MSFEQIYWIKIIKVNTRQHAQPFFFWAMDPTLTFPTGWTMTHLFTWWPSAELNPCREGCHKSLPNS